jgi:hypothetical protein
MNGQVTPRSIVYIAILVSCLPVSFSAPNMISKAHFAATNLTCWTEDYCGLNYKAMYDYFVDYFEVTSTPRAKKEIEDLLTWWNMYVLLPSYCSSTNYQGLQASLSQWSFSHS